MNNAKLLDTIAAHIGALNDAQLAKALGFGTSRISYIRQGKRPFADDLVLACYEKLGIAIEQVRAWQNTPEEEGEE